MTKNDKNNNAETAFFAGGCFWGMEYYFSNVEGVLSTRVGYTGGDNENPTYEEVCSGTTGHIETLEVIFDPEKTDYLTLAKLFFEIHDPTQWNRQGPDVGIQYRSAVFYLNVRQKETINHLIDLLKRKGLNVVTEVRKAGPFWPAEDHHQRYYEKQGGKPYCHFRVKRF